MKKVGFIGWRGMVGSVLMNRMQEEEDFKLIEASFFTTSQLGQNAPTYVGSPPLKNAHDTQQLAEMDIIITCQGGDYTQEIFPTLRNSGWSGYWIDAASTLRMQDDCVLILDPLNGDKIKQAIGDGKKNFIGANCTVSLMLMALAGLFKNDLIEWVSSMTYQAASGAGARNMCELIQQMDYLGERTKTLIADPATSILDLDKTVSTLLRGQEFPSELFGVPLAGSLIPWIDSAVEHGQTREEWKGSVETNKILASKTIVPVDGICVRVSTMRCHSQAFTIKLKKDLPLEQIENLLSKAHPWVDLIPNDKTSTLKDLSPTAVSGTLRIPIGRVRKLQLGPEYITAFTVGDQLLWGAAEPLRRVLRMLINE